MAMKKTPGGDSPLRQGAGKSFWTLPIFGSLEAPVNIWTSGFCFVQFREYFLCNFSETQKQQKIGNWHCGISLIG
jgi:hypothetical protein